MSIQDKFSANEKKVIGAMACFIAGIFVGNEIKDDGSQEIEALRKEATLSLCEGSRLALGHVLEHPKAYKIKDSNIEDSRAKNEALQRVPCEDEETFASDKTLHNVLYSYPGQNGEIENSKDPVVQEVDWGSLGNIYYWAKVGISRIKKTPREVNKASLEFMQDQRNFMKSAFLRRHQNR